MDTTTERAGIEALVRECAPRALGALARRWDDFADAEDACQEALLAAAQQWPVDGVPGNPVGWLVRVGSRRLVDRRRSDRARIDRELREAARMPAADLVSPGADVGVFDGRFDGRFDSRFDSRFDGGLVDSRYGGQDGSAADDTLALFVLCCHPALTPAAQVPLVLRAVAGLSAAQIARGLLVPEPTVAQRISRAKARLRESGARFVAPSAEELPQRLPTVLQALYLVFTEGHASTAGERVHDVTLTREAIRLTRLLLDALRRLPGDSAERPADLMPQRPTDRQADRQADLVPDLVPDRPADRRADSVLELEAEATGLLALMLLSGARAPARVAADGSLVPLGEQDRSLWDHALLAEGIRLVEQTLPTGPVGPFLLQAAIAAVHAEAASWADTDWLQVVVLYRTLQRVAPGPVVTLNLAVAAAMVHGPATGLRMSELLLHEPALRHSHRVHAVRAHLHEAAGDRAAAREAYRRAAVLTTSVPEQRYLNARLAALDESVATSTPRPLVTPED